MVGRLPRLRGIARRPRRVTEVATADEGEAGPDGKDHGSRRRRPAGGKNACPWALGNPRAALPLLVPSRAPDERASVFESAVERAANTSEECRRRADPSVIDVIA